MHSLLEALIKKAQNEYMIRALEEVEADTAAIRNLGARLEQIHSIIRGWADRASGVYVAHGTASELKQKIHRAQIPKTPKTQLHILHLHARRLLR